jgi:hypothetical protein
MYDVIKLSKNNLCDLIVPERLDLIIKYLYVKSYFDKIDREYYIDLYKRHIAFRTGGVEDKKKSLDDYINNFDKLIISIEKHGFKKEHAIPVSTTNGIILNGAHRLACCIYFKSDCYIYYKDQEGIKWDYEWLKKYKFQDDLSIIYKHYIDLKPNETFIAILWGSSKNEWSKIVDYIRKKYKIIGDKEFSLNKQALSNVVEDIYSYEFGVYPSARIKEKIRYLSTYPLLISLVVINIDNATYNLKDGKPVCFELESLKNEIRMILENKVNVDKFITLHTSDNKQHTKHISNILLNDFSLTNLMNRRKIEYRKIFLEWLDEYSKILIKYKIDPDNCCIVGSSSLEVMGLRNSTDIDFVLKSNFRDGKFSDKFQALSENVDIVSLGYHNHTDDRQTINDDELINDFRKHFYFRGLKFASIKIIRDRKAYQRRPKDMKDVFLIDQFLREKDSSKNNIRIRIISKKFRMNAYVFYISNIKYGFLLKIRVLISNLLSSKQKKIIKKILKKVKWILK